MAPIVDPDNKKLFIVLIFAGILMIGLIVYRRCDIFHNPRTRGIQRSCDSDTGKSWTYTTPGLYYDPEHKYCRSVIGHHADPCSHSRPDDEDISKIPLRPHHDISSNDRDGSPGYGSTGGFVRGCQPTAVHTHGESGIGQWKTG